MRLTLAILCLSVSNLFAVGSGRQPPQINNSTADQVAQSNTSSGTVRGMFRAARDGNARVCIGKENPLLCGEIIGEKLVVKSTQPADGMRIVAPNACHYVSGDVLGFSMCMSDTDGGVHFSAFGGTIDLVPSSIPNEMDFFTNRNRYVFDKPITVPSCIGCGGGSGSGDNLGNHRATQTIDANNFDLANGATGYFQVVNSSEVKTSTITANSPLTVRASQIRMEAPTYWRMNGSTAVVTSDGFSLQVDGSGANASTSTGTITTSGGQPFTEETWAKSDGQSGQECLMTYGNTGLGNSSTLCFNQPPASIIGIYWTDTAVDNNVSTSLVVGTWYQVAVSYDGAGTLSFHVSNDVGTQLIFVGSTTYTPSIPATTNIILGTRANGSAPFKGRIDQARFSNVARYSPGVNYPTTNRFTADGATFGLYPLDEGGGTYAADASTQANSLTLGGAATWDTGHPGSGPTTMMNIPGVVGSTVTPQGLVAGTTAEFRLLVVSTIQANSPLTIQASNVNVQAPLNAQALSVNNFQVLTTTSGASSASINSLTVALSTTGTALTALQNAFSTTTLVMQAQINSNVVAVDTNAAAFRVYTATTQSVLNSLQSQISLNTVAIDTNAAAFRVYAATAASAETAYRATITTTTNFLQAQITSNLATSVTTFMDLSADTDTKKGGGIFQGGVVAQAGFTGDGSSVTNVTVLASSVSVATRNVNSVTDVAVTTLTFTVRGNRPTKVCGAIDIDNNSLLIRTYTLDIKVDGVSLFPAPLNGPTPTIAAGDSGFYQLCGTSSSIGAGSHNFTMQVHSSAANTTQTSSWSEVILEEF